MGLSFSHHTPTVSDVHAFVTAINKGRAHAGLPLIGTIEQVENDEGYIALDFDACEPGNPHSCLSATYLSTPLGFVSGGDAFSRNLMTSGERPGPEQFAALKAAGAEPADWNENFLTIPETILRVTDPFDYADEGENDALRTVFAEAGYIDPAELLDNAPPVRCSPYGDGDDDLL